MSDPAAEFDGPWKEVLGLYFGPFVELFFPDIHREVDWDREIDWQDKELPKIFPDAAAGTGTVDKLAGVWTRAGEQERVFVHVEVQTQNDPDLADRMYRYNHRLEDRYGTMPVSLAVLGDWGRSWRPGEYRAGRWGCEVTFTFRTAKLANWRGREDALERSLNPFAVFVLAHLKTVETDRAPADRLAWKSRIVKGLYDRGFTKLKLIRLFHLIEWVIKLPPVQRVLFHREMVAFEKERTVTPLPPLFQDIRDEALTEGVAEGLQRAVGLGLKRRFGQAGLDLVPRVKTVTDVAALENLIDAVHAVADVTAFAALLPAQT